SHAVGRDRAIDPWQVNPEGGSVADLAIDPDAAAALIDDPVYGGEPQPSTLPGLFRREKRLENTRLGVLIHPNTGVRYGKHCVVADLSAYMLASVLFTQDHVGGLDGEPAA